MLNDQIKKIVEPVLSDKFETFQKQIEKILIKRLEQRLNTLQVEVEKKYQNQLNKLQELLLKAAVEQDKEINMLKKKVKS